MTRVLLIVIGFILYGSLYPWQYRHGPSGVDPLTVLLHSWPAKITPQIYSDIVVNVLLYIPVGLFGFLAVDRHGHRGLRWVSPVAIGFVLSGSIEMLQIYDVTRDCSLLDLFDNTLGAALGTAIAFMYRESMSDSILLVMQWLGYQVCILFAIFAGRQPALHLFASRLDKITVVSAWGIVVYLLAMPAEPVRRSRMSIFIACGFTALILARELAPFHLQHSPTPFSWVPFLGMLRSEWIVGLPIFLQKSFLYGTAIWLIRSAGWTLLRSTMLITALLAVTETIQRYLPGRTPEITDPLMALVFGFVLWLVEQDYKRVKALDILQVQT